MSEHIEKSKNLTKKRILETINPRPLLTEKTQSLVFIEYTDITKSQINSHNFYVYSHVRKTDGSIFYIGKGKGGRGYSKSGRNKEWHEIAGKEGAVLIFVEGFEKEKDAFLCEVRLIKELRGALCNKSGGGQGASGVVHTAETKEKFRKAKLGRPQSAEHAMKSRVAKVGKKQPKSAIDALVKLKSKPVINSDGEVFSSASEAARVFSRRLGKNIIQGNISMCCRGKRNNAYGKTWSYNTEIIPSFAPTKYAKKTIQCIETGEIFTSVQEACKKIRISHQCLSKAARDGGRCGGYHWRYT